MSARYQIGAWEVDPLQRTLRRDHESKTLSPRAMDVLVHLATHPGDVVSGSVLIQAHWPRTVTAPNAIQKIVTELRHALRASADGNTYIETVPKRGYRLVAPVERIDSIQSPQASSAANGSNHGRMAPTNGTDTPMASTKQSSKWGSRRTVTLAGASTITLVLMVTMLLGLRTTEHSAPGVSSPKSMAVLRFRNLDEKAGREYLGAGIANALTTQLSRAPGLTVASSERAFQHSVETESIQGIGKALDVQYVLDGSVQGSGDKLHASVVLYDARDGHQVYAYTHDEPFGEVLALQDKTIADVLSELEIQLDDQRAAEMRDWGTKNVKAYLAAVEGHVTRMRHDPVSMRYGISLLRQAIQTDPAFVAAYEDLAAGLLDLTALSRDANLRESARQEVAQLRQTAIRIDPTSGYLSGFAVIEAELTNNAPEYLETVSRSEIQRIGIPMQSNTIYFWYSDLLRIGHLFNESIAYLNLYDQLDPTNPWVNLRREALIADTEGANRAIPYYKRNLANFPNDIGSLAGLIINLGMVKNFDEAALYLRHLQEVDEDGYWAFGTETMLKIVRGELTSGSPDLRERLDDPRSTAFADGIAYLMVGDIEAGLASWRSMDSSNLYVARNFTVDEEHFFPRSVVEDERYQTYLDEMGIGRKWTAYLREKVATLSPITGIKPSDSSPQVAVNR